MHPVEDRRRPAGLCVRVQVGLDRQVLPTDRRVCRCGARHSATATTPADARHYARRHARLLPSTTSIAAIVSAALLLSAATTTFLAVLLQQPAKPQQPTQLQLANQQARLRWQLRLNAHTYGRRRAQ